MRTSRLPNTIKDGQSFTVFKQPRCRNKEIIRGKWPSPNISLYYLRLHPVSKKLMMRSKHVRTCWRQNARKTKMFTFYSKYTTTTTKHPVPCANHFKTHIHAFDPNTVVKILTDSTTTNQVIQKFKRFKQTKSDETSETSPQHSFLGNTATDLSK